MTVAESILPASSSQPDTIQPPANLDAEQGVLGGAFHRGELDQLAAIVTAADFHQPRHRLIWRAMERLSERGMALDLITVATELGDELERAGGKPYLAELVSSIVSSAHAAHYARMVAELAGLRRLIAVGTKLTREASHPRADLRDLCDRTSQAADRIAARDRDDTAHATGQLADAAMANLAELAARDGALTGVDTGYAKLNEYTAGLQPSDLIILAARPSMGKTAFALNLALNAATASPETPVMVFSLEMSKEQLASRMLCIQGGVDLSRVRRGWLSESDWSALRGARDVLARLPLWIDDTPALGVMDLRARARRMRRERGVGLVIVDYLQLMRASHRVDSREQEISDISRNLKALAKELNIPVIALSQLNRKVEERSNRRPMLSDLRESGAIEQDADMIVFLYRDEVYNKETPAKGIAEVIIGKQRNGPVGELELLFRAESNRFVEDAPSPEGLPRVGQGELA
ncbi:replicative DNA helicase [Desulfohalovibrio reitneri]|uniref:replicative DNA helicase n=1 Tax=Desulfohalovibrio reitneri TaxID=1307759 RepID=UPI0009DDFE8F|nr:replicative DNA helicase [Desulfohalovibrio reitneri]